MGLFPPQSVPVRASRDHCLDSSPTDGCLELLPREGLKQKDWVSFFVNLQGLAQLNILHTSMFSLNTTAVVNDLTMSLKLTLQTLVLICCDSHLPENLQIS